MKKYPFDVFLAHRSVDKPMVRKIYQRLIERGLNPWFDEEVISPGSSFQKELQQAIGSVRAGVICIGGEPSPWQLLEFKSLTSQSVKRGIPIIPALLPGVSNIPEALLFLAEFHYVRFRSGINDTNAMYQLEWGITGRKPVQLSMSVTNKLNQAELRRSLPCSYEPSACLVENINRTAAIELSSEVGIDYSYLRGLLKGRDWKGADKETRHRMLEAVGKGRRERLTIEDIKNFPCADLAIIDSLWRSYSNNRFGFGVQTEILGLITRETNEGKEYGAWQTFCTRVGWQNEGKSVGYSSITFSTAAPDGHLPVLGRDSNLRDPSADSSWGELIVFLSLCWGVFVFRTLLELGVLAMFIWLAGCFLLVFGAGKLLRSAPLLPHIVSRYDKCDLR